MNKEKAFRMFFAAGIGIVFGYWLIKHALADMINVSAWYSLAGGAGGALAAYVLEDLKSAALAVPRALNFAFGRLIPGVFGSIGRGIAGAAKAWWNQSFELMIWNWLAFVCVFIDLMVAWFALTLLFVLPLPQARQALIEIGVVSGVIIYFFAVLFLPIVGFFKWLDSSQEQCVNNAKYIVKIFAPPFWMGRLIKFAFVKAMPAILKLAWVGLRVAPLFFYTFFRLIHTERRFIAAADAFAFVMLAFAFSDLAGIMIGPSLTVHALVFAGAGGLFGVFNQAVISPALDRLERIWAMCRIY